MSSMVCRGVQSCFEPMLFEPCGLRNKFLLTKPNQRPQNPLILEKQNAQQENPCNQEEFNHKNKIPDNRFSHENNKVADASDWSLIQSLTRKNEPSNQDENVYVHPLVKKSSSVLSLKSLEMCTESLGSETGTEEFTFPLTPKNNEKYRQMWRLKYKNFNKKVVGNNNFPPPLTSFSGSGGVQVTQHREGGRLVLKAATVSACNSNFQAERVDGRLTLKLVEDDSPNSEEHEKDVEEEYEDDDENGDEDIGEDSENHGDEFGVGERSMLSRCKESGHENKVMPNWEPCWVAIS